MKLKAINEEKTSASSYLGEDMLHPAKSWYVLSWLFVALLLNLLPLENIAYMFQGPNLLDWRNCYQNLLIFHPSATQSDAHNALELVGLGDKGLQYPRQLSLGQQRRLALARTFLSKADLVLLDEPFTSLDPQLKSDMLELTRNLLDQSGATLVHVTHDAAEAKTLDAQAIQMQGKPATLQSP